MAEYPVDEDIKDIFYSNFKFRPKTLKDFDEYVYAHKVDIYAAYLKKKFDQIDIKYYYQSQGNDNKRCKGELLLAGIIDLTMWRFGFSLGKDYTVTGAKEGKKGVDFKLTCLNTVFLCEAKNWAETTWVEKDTYNNKIRTRFFCDGINVLMILNNKIQAVEKMYQKYSTVNGNPINYIEIDNFMDTFENSPYFTGYIAQNLFSGTNQMTVHVVKNLGMDRDFSLIECLQMGMPNWFISEYTKKSEKTVNRKAKALGYKRRSSAYKKLISYRYIR